jgi:hypothetical protein
LQLPRRKKKKWKKEWEISEETVEKSVRLPMVLQPAVFPDPKARRALDVAASLQSRVAFAEGFKRDYQDRSIVGFTPAMMRMTTSSTP